MRSPFQRIKVSYNAVGSPCAAHRSQCERNGYRWRLHGNPTAIYASPLRLHCVSTALPRLYHCSTTALPRLYPGSTTALPRLYHGSTTALPLLYHCSTTALPRLYHCSTTALPLLYHGSTTALPLLYHCSTTAHLGRLHGALFFLFFLVRSYGDHCALIAFISPIGVCMTINQRNQKV